MNLVSINFNSLLKNEHYEKNIFFLLVALSNISMYGQCWESITGGYSHNLATKSDGTLWAWGANGYGMLGNGTLIGSSFPIPIGTANDWKMATSGYFHNLAIKNDGTLWAWGRNSSAQVGNGATRILSPVQIGSSSDWKDIGAGQDYSMALKTDGTIWAWGQSISINGTTPTKIGTANDWMNIKCSPRSYFAQKTNGTLWAWGYNTAGNLGDGTLIDKNSPTQIGTATDWQVIAPGAAHTLALKTNGTLWAWGKNFWGQLGDGTKTHQLSPIQIGTANDWKNINAGDGHSVAIKTDGTIWAWGINLKGQLGNGTRMESMIPIQIGTANNWKGIYAGEFTTMAIDNDNQLQICGFNGAAQIGDSTNIDRLNLVPIATTCANGLRVSSKIYLQGSFNANSILMNDDLRAAGLLPVTEPFTALGIALKNGKNAAVSNQLSVFSDKENNSIVDWIVIELRNSSDASQVLFSRPFLLQRDGDIVNLDGETPAGFPNAPAATYYMAIIHRNHLGIRTASPIALTPTAISLNFTNNSVALQGVIPTIQMAANSYALIAGDANHDGSIDAFDTIIWGAQNGLFDDYTKNADYNMDGSIDAFDSIIWEYNNGKFEEFD